MMNLTVSDFTLPEKLDLEDRWILSKYNTVVREVTDNLDRFELGIAAEKLYSFIWDSYCDWYIELCKTRLTDKENKDASDRAQACAGIRPDRNSPAAAPVYAVYYRIHLAGAASRRNFHYDFRMA